MTERGVRLIVSGHVQGVGFRVFTNNQARALGLRGSVRNRRDGTVEATASGPTNLIDDFIKALHGGPGRVDHVNVEDLSAEHVAQLKPGFSITKTA